MINAAEKRTKIVCTIGPASNSPAVLEQMIVAGMNVARLNLAHGVFPDHARIISNVRAAAKKLDRRVAVLADLPGPKIRIGRLSEDPVELEIGDPFVLSVGDAEGGARGASTTFAQLPHVVRPGNTIFLNDGLIQVEVERIHGANVHCVVRVGGTLRSHKGINLPNLDLGVRAFTDHDRECLAFAVGEGVDAISQSFVADATDIQQVRAAARAVGGDPLIIAKIERVQAVANIDAILRAADAIMVARGDLGVELPIEEIAIAQKDLIRRANYVGEPVITATQMLESMVSNRRPTRAEATDVANAILDGTDCVMLSEESAMGSYPVDAVRMLTKIALATEPHLRLRRFRRERPIGAGDEIDNAELVARGVAEMTQMIRPVGVVVPTETGATVRRISRYRLPVTITAVSRSERTCQQLQLCYGVMAVHHPDPDASWYAVIKSYFAQRGVTKGRVLMTEGSGMGRGTNRLEIIDLSPSQPATRMEAK
jgi:pyruvate kinase